MVRYYFWTIMWEIVVWIWKKNNNWHKWDIQIIMIWYCYLKKKILFLLGQMTRTLLFMCPQSLLFLQYLLPKRIRCKFDSVWCYEDWCKCKNVVNKIYVFSSKIWYFGNSLCLMLTTVTQLINWFVSDSIIPYHLSPKLMGQYA